MFDYGNIKRYDPTLVDLISNYKLLYKRESLIYSETCLKRSLKKNDKTKILMTNGSLMKVKSIAECSRSIYEIESNNKFKPWDLVCSISNRLLGLYIILEY